MSGTSPTTCWRWLQGPHCTPSRHARALQIIPTCASRVRRVVGVNLLREASTSGVSLVAISTPTRRASCAARRRSSRPSAAPPATSRHGDHVRRQGTDAAQGAGRDRPAPRDPVAYNEDRDHATTISKGSPTRRVPAVRGKTPSAAARVRRAKAKAGRCRVGLGARRRARGEMFAAPTTCASIRRPPARRDRELRREMRELEERRCNVTNRLAPSPVPLRGARRRRRAAARAPASQAVARAAGSTG